MSHDQIEDPGGHFAAIDNVKNPQGVASNLREFLERGGSNGNGNGQHATDPPIVHRPTSVLDSALELESLGFWVIAIHKRGVTIKTRDGEKIAEGKEPIGAAWGLARRSKGWLRGNSTEIRAAVSAFVSGLNVALSGVG